MANSRPSASRRAENARQKAERLRAAQRRRERNRRLMIVSSVSTFVVGALALAVVFWPSSSTAKAASPASSSSSSSGSATTLAPAGALTGSPVDGIQSGAMEQLAFHIHAHLQIYVDGKQKQLPYGIGIVRPYQMTTDAEGNPFAEGGKAIYWLHTHDQSGIIHMEAPIQVSFTLGEFFDMWGQPLTTGEVGPAHGPLTVFVNGKTVSGDPRAIPLNAHDVIQLDVGSVVPFQSYTFPAGL